MNEEVLARLKKEIEEPAALYERALGKLSIRFSLLHSLVEEFAWRIWGLNSDIGTIVTKDLPTKQLVKKLRDSAKLFLPQEAARKELLTILSKVEKAADRRNEFLHSIWIVKNGEPTLCISRKRGLLLDRDAPSAEDINDLTREIMNLVADFMEFKDGKSVSTRIKEMLSRWGSTP